MELAGWSVLAWLSHLLVVGCIHVHRHAHAQQRQQEQRVKRDKPDKCGGCRRGMSSQAVRPKQMCERKRLGSEGAFFALGAP